MATTRRTSLISPGFASPRCSPASVKPVPRRPLVADVSTSHCLSRRVNRSLDATHCLFHWRLQLCTFSIEATNDTFMSLFHRLSAAVWWQLINRTQFGRRSFHATAPVIWNSLPVRLRSASISRGQFSLGFNPTSSHKPTHDPLRTLVLRLYLLTYLWVWSVSADTRWHARVTWFKFI